MVGFHYENYVRLQGLSDAAYNGKLARIQCFSASENDGKYRVKLQVDEEVAVASQLSRELLVKPENMARACDCCHQSGAVTMQYCGRCRNAAYCNAVCQRSDWTRHKEDCGGMNARRQILKSPLILAAGMGNLAEVENLVRAGADLNKATKEEGGSPLQLAAGCGHLAVVQYLLQHGADKNKTDINGCTPLHSAAGYGRLAVVQYLVQQGVDRNGANNEGSTPLYVAAHEGHSAVVQYLVQQGVDKNKAGNAGYTPLHIAAQNGHLAVVQCLVQQGADKDKAANVGATALFMAALHGHLSVCNIWCSKERTSARLMTMVRLLSTLQLRMAT